MCTRPPSEIGRLIAAGISDGEISWITGVPRTTVRDIRRPRYVRKRVGEVCPRCWLAAKRMRFTPADYAELLGLYLGDGCISPHPRTARLRISLDAKYPQIVAEARDNLERSMPHNRVDVVGSTATTGNCVNVSVYSRHLPCLFPQHGPGKKHDRPIELEPWQLRIVDAAPWALLRGLIRSDGCVFINRTDVHRPVPCEYLSYGFSNRSADIAGLFTRACDLVEVKCRSTFTPKRGLWQVRINRRPSVALMLEHVGRKV